MKAEGFSYGFDLYKRKGTLFYVISQEAGDGDLLKKYLRIQIEKRNDSAGACTAAFKG